ncbi:hypothetical protein ACEQ8H_007962 [Pleosporales sp. CAS-2024a]
MAAPHLLHLPAELHVCIIEKLDLHHRVSLASTNRYFRAVVPAPSCEDYLIAETKTWAKDRGLFTCWGCASFRRFDDFADDMKKGKRTRGGAESCQRLCLRCGITRGLYALGCNITKADSPDR